MTTQETNNDNGAAQPAAVAGKRANWVIAHQINGQTITWTVKGAGTLTLDVTKVAVENRQRAELHGFVQRVSDAAAISRNPETGKPATPQEKFDAMQSLVNHYMSGAVEWSPKRAEGGARERTLGGVALLRAALAIAKPNMTQDAIVEWTKKLNQKEVAALLVAPQLADAVALAREAALKAAGEGVDAGKLLEGLE